MQIPTTIPLFFNVHLPHPHPTQNPKYQEIQNSINNEGVLRYIYHESQHEKSKPKAFVQTDRFVFPIDAKSYENRDYVKNGSPGGKGGVSKLDKCEMGKEKYHEIQKVERNDESTRISSSSLFFVIVVVASAGVVDRERNI